MNEPNMDQEEVLDPNAQKELTPEEYLKARDQAIDHLKKEIVYLKVEKEYEVLSADIEEAKTRRITMIAQRARFYQKQEAPETQTPVAANAGMPAQSEVTPNEPLKKRTLKKD